MNINYKLENSATLYEFTYTNPDNLNENFNKQHFSMIKSLIKSGATSIKGSLFHLYNPEVNHYILTTNELANRKFYLYKYISNKAKAKFNIYSQKLLGRSEEGRQATQRNLPRNHAERRSGVNQKQNEHNQKHCICS